MLIVMFIDPILQNAILYYLIQYMSLSYDEGGCCINNSIHRAYVAFVCAYLLVWVISTGFITAALFKGLTNREEWEGDEPEDKRYKFTFILTAAFFNMHLFLFGFVPSLHSYFDIQEIYQTIRAVNSRNIPQVLLQITIIGLLMMNFSPKPAIDLEAGIPVVYEETQASSILFTLTCLCCFQIPFNVAEFTLML